MPVAYEIEVLEVNLELAAASGQVMHLVRQGKAFGPLWTAACERQNAAFKSWRRVIDRPCAPRFTVRPLASAPSADAVPVGQQVADGLRQVHKAERLG